MENDKEFTSYFEEILYHLAFSKNINTDEQELEKYKCLKKNYSIDAYSVPPVKDPQQNTEGKFIKEEDLKPLLELARNANAINTKLEVENQALKDRIASLEIKQFEAFMEGQDKAIAEKEAKIAINEKLEAENQALKDRIAALEQEMSGHKEMSQNVSIATNKKTNVIFALAAMLKAHWLDTGLNRDDTINEILRNAFGEQDDSTISALLNPIFNRAKNRTPDAIADDLINEISEEIRNSVQEMKKKRTPK